MGGILFISPFTPLTDRNRPATLGSKELLETVRLSKWTLPQPDTMAGKSLDIPKTSLGGQTSSFSSSASQAVLVPLKHTLTLTGVSGNSRQRSRRIWLGLHRCSTSHLAYGKLFCSVYSL